MLNELQYNLRSAWAIWKLGKALKDVDINAQTREEIMYQFKRQVGWK